ncbi:hypothetical protein ElyMa_003661800 [Elysia marginata]|uniref:Transmembrane protein n=1 Tax=Elysia marginata TaxID=1093978 RepID=A0AAV4EWL1_9GAST|nr:hypothetical protein ElyMa_003661800 [Elysia marginata]
MERYRETPDGSWKRQRDIAKVVVVTVVVVLVVVVVVLVVAVVVAVEAVWLFICRTTFVFKPADSSDFETCKIVWQIAR